MSVFLPQQKYPLWSSSWHVRSCVRPLLPRRLNCTAAATTAATTSKPMHRPNPPIIETPKCITKHDLSLRSTWTHRAWVASGCGSVLIALAKSIAIAASFQLWPEPILAGLAGYVLADLGSGVYHWGIDNYGDSSTPLFGAQIEAFQGHHRQPWTITQRQFANNLHALGQSVTIAVLPTNLLCDDSTFLAFAAVCSGCIMFSQQFHAWAHSKRRSLPPVVVALQNAGVLVSPVQHAAHHRQPYNNNYCIVSGVWNEFLDKQKVFEGLEMVLFFRFGVRPRSWSEPGSEWTEGTHDDTN